MFASIVTVGVGLVGAAGCGSTPDAATGPDGSSALPAPTKATLVLDYLPNAVHAGIYRAQAQGYYRKRNLDLRIIAPTSTSDTLKLIDSGKADFGIADGIDLAGQIDAGRDAQAVMAVVQRPLGGIITLKKAGIDTPRALEGKTVGVTGVPSDAAVLDTIIRDDGGDPTKVKRVTIGFGGVAALENRKVDAFVGFYAADGVQVEEDGFPTTTFAFDDHGGPRYPGLVAFTTRAKVGDSTALLRAFVAATIDGYNDTIKDPGAALDDLLAGAKGLQRPLAAAQLAAYGPLFQAEADTFGPINTGDIAGLSAFLVDANLIDAPIAPSRYATSVALPRQ